MKNYPLLCSIFLIYLTAGTQTLQKFEPADGRVLHGLGQFTSDYPQAENWQQVSAYQQAAGQVPVIYSVYAFLDPVLAAADSTDLSDITQNHGYPYLLLIGISLHDTTYLRTGEYNIPVEAILNGSLDYRIIEIAGQVKAIDSPVWLRPGFEFGTGNRGIHEDADLSAAEFIEIWQRIYNLFEQENVDNVAWVWNTVNPDKFDFMDWYPGDAFVDWWGLNLFTTGQINSSEAFLGAAADRDRPVIICESCPISNNGVLNDSNWNDWFVPYFNLIRTTPNIKAFVYISDPWAEGLFSEWPESRLEQNTYIAGHYASEMQNPIYLHMAEYLAALSQAAQPVYRKSFQLRNAPNPFNPSTLIHFNLPVAGRVRLEIFSGLGQKLRVLPDEVRPAGEHSIRFEAGALPAGLYFYRLLLDNRPAAVGKCLLVR